MRSRSFASSPRGTPVACHWAEQIKSGELRPHKVKPVFDPGIEEPAYEPPPGLAGLRAASLD